MDLENIYANVECRNIEDTSGARTQRNSQDEGKVEKLRGRQTLLLMTVSLGLICVLLLVFIIWLNISITAERDLLKRYETTVQEFNHTINSLQTNYTDLRTEKERLKKSLSSLSQKNQECENNIRSLSDELTKASKQGWFFMTNEAKSWSEIRQFCRDRGADLVMIKTEEKQRMITSFIKESVWIGLTDSDTEGTMKWVDNSSLNQKFWRNGEPNNYIKDEDCVEMRLTGGPPPLNNWNDLPCSEMRKGICEK